MPKTTRYIMYVLFAIAGALVVHTAYRVYKQVRNIEKIEVEINAKEKPAKTEVSAGLK